MPKFEEWLQISNINLKGANLKQLKECYHKRKRNMKIERSKILKRFCKSPFYVITKKGDIFEIIDYIKENDIKNVILLIICPPPVEPISIDIIALRESLSVPEIKHIIIVRHEGTIDGSICFFNYIGIFSYLKQWYLTFRCPVANYCFGSVIKPVIKTRYMFVFSRNDTEIILEKPIGRKRFFLDENDELYECEWGSLVKINSKTYTNTYPIF